MRSASLNLPMHIDNCSSNRINVVGFWLAPARSACDMFALNLSAKCNHSPRVQVFGRVRATDYRRNSSRRELFANRVCHIAQRCISQARSLPAHNHWSHALVGWAVARPELPRPCYRFSNHLLPSQKSALVTRRRTNQSTRTGAIKPRQPVISAVSRLAHLPAVFAGPALGKAPTQPHAPGACTPRRSSAPSSRCR